VPEQLTNAADDEQDQAQIVPLRQVFPKGDSLFLKRRKKREEGGSVRDGDRRGKKGFVVGD